MNILAVCAAAAILCGMVLFIRTVNVPISYMMSAVLCIFVGASVYLSVKDPVKYINETVHSTPIAPYSPYILKSVAICFVCKTCRDVCESLGERAVASQIDTAGKISVLTVCLPLIGEIVSTALGYLS